MHRLDWLLLAVVLATAAACEDDVDLTDPVPYGYETGPVAIVNPDWGVLPLPSNFLNPIKQAEVVAIPGVEAETPPPSTLALPVVDAAAAQTAQDLGYDVEEDNPLTRAILAGQNRLDGFIASFAPSIPFSRPVDLDSVVPYDGTNGATANLWLVDVTDPAAPEVLQPGDYLRVANWQLAEEMPFTLTLRLPPAGVLQPPQDFASGHTYLVVATGWTDRGLKEKLSEADLAAGEVARPVTADGPFLLFAAPTEFADTGTTYIGPDGLARSGVVSGLEAARTLEGGRQLTDWGLKVWESLPGVAEAWTRAEVVTAYHFTIATNPAPDYFDPVGALLGTNAVKPTPADALDRDEGTMKPAEAPCDAALAFALDKPVRADSVNAASVRLFRVAEGAYTAVDLAVTVADATGGPVVQAAPKAALQADSLYLAVVTNGVRSADGSRAAVDQTYFGLARAALKQQNADTGAVTFLDTPLVSVDDEGDPVAWNSPYLDSRLDTLILSGQVANISTSQLASAGQTMLVVLHYLEGLRRHLKPHLDFVVLGADGLPGVPGEPGVDNVVAEREDVVLAWTFTTGACGPQGGGAR
jgi:hypothetical protein